MHEVTRGISTLFYILCSRELVVVYYNSQSELYVARYEESSTDPVCIKFGEFSSIAGTTMSDGQISVSAYFVTVLFRCSRLCILQDRRPLASRDKLSG